MDQEDGTCLPASLQHNEYTATDAPAVSLSGQLLEDGIRENRSCRGNSVGRTTSYADCETLQLVRANVPETCKVVTFLGVSRPLMWSGIEPQSDVIFPFPLVRPSPDASPGRAFCSSETSNGRGVRGKLQAVACDIRSGLLRIALFLVFGQVGICV